MSLGMPHCAVAPPFTYHRPCEGRYTAKSALPSPVKSPLVWVTVPVEKLMAAWALRLSVTAKRVHCVVPQVTAGSPGAVKVLVTVTLIGPKPPEPLDRKSTRLNSSHANISYAVFCLKKK